MLSVTTWFTEAGAPTADRTRNGDSYIRSWLPPARCVVCVHRAWSGHRWSRSFSEAC